MKLFGRCLWNVITTGHLHTYLAASRFHEVWQYETILKIAQSGIDNTIIYFRAVFGLTSNRSTIPHHNEYTKATLNGSHRQLSNKCIPCSLLLARCICCALPLIRRRRLLGVAMKINNTVLRGKHTSYVKYLMYIRTHISYMCFNG